MRKLLPLTLASITALATVGCAKEKDFTESVSPAITVDQWVSLPKETEAPTAASLKGKIIYLYFFQSWCPGCHSSGFPALQKVSTHFEGDADVQCIAVQTVFEGFSTNTPSKALAIAKKYKLTGIPVGHSGSTNNPSKLMSDFKTRGTPWTVIIDSKGMIKFSDFHINPDVAIKAINSLKKEQVK